MTNYAIFDDIKFMSVMSYQFIRYNSSSIEIAITAIAFLLVNTVFKFKFKYGGEKMFQFV